MATVNDTDMLAALSSGIESGGTTPPPEETTDETVEDTSTDDTGADDTTGAAAADETGASVDGGGNTDESNAGEDEAGEAKLGPDGKPLAPVTAKDGEPPPVDAAKPPKVKDAINDPLPVGLKEATRERMTSLIDTAKKLTTERDTVTAQYQEVMSLIQETQATPEQYGQALDYIRMVNSQDPAQIAQCIKFMQGELTALSKLAGVPVAGVDLLSEHEDLRQEVADGALTRQRAEEIAAARGNQQVRNAHSTAAAASADQRTTIARGVADLNALETQLKESDPHYASKRAILVESLKPVFNEIHPSKWAATFKAAYSKLPNPAPVVKPAAAKPAAPGTKVPVNQPLRARNPAGAQQAAPKDMLDAVSQGIASAAR